MPINGLSVNSPVKPPPSVVVGGFRADCSKCKLANCKRARLTTVVTNISLSTRDSSAGSSPFHRSVTPRGTRIPFPSPDSQSVIARDNASQKSHRPQSVPPPPESPPPPNPHKPVLDGGEVRISHSRIWYLSNGTSVIDIL